MAGEQGQGAGSNKCNAECTKVSTMIMMRGAVLPLVSKSIRFGL